MKQIHRISAWIFLILSGVFLICGLTACRLSERDALTADKKELILIYMVGSDLESERGLASKDLQEIRESGFNEKNIQIVVCTGGAAYWWNDSVSEDECGIFEVHPDRELEKVDTLTHTNMAEADTLTEFLDYVYENYEADSYSLILWNHGGGAIVGYGGDENYCYDTLNLCELDTAFGASKLIKDGERLEWIGFDACLMGMLEVANVCIPYADYLVASEGMAWEQGWNYDFLNRLDVSMVGSGRAVGQEIVDAYADYYTSMTACNPEYTLSCMDLSQTESVIERLEALIQNADADLGNGDYSMLARERDQTKTFSITSVVGRSVDYDTVDLYHLSERLAVYYPAEAAALQEAIHQMVVYQKSNVADANGVAVYFPYRNKEDIPVWLEEYERIGFSNGYVEFIREFAQVLTGEALTDWELSQVVPVSKQEYSISLTPEQMKDYSHAILSVWEGIHGEEESYAGSYIMWIESSDVVLDENGTLYAMSAQRRFVLCDEAGHRADCSATELERNDSYAIYGIAVYLSRAENGAEENTKTGMSEFDSDWATIYVRVDEENPDGVITGIYKGYDNLDIQMPGRVAYEIEQGTEISPFAYIREIAFEEDGSVAPFMEWRSNSSIFTGFSLEGTLSVTMEEIDADADLCHVFFIRDTQGIVYEAIGDVDEQ